MHRFKVGREFGKTVRDTINSSEADRMIHRPGAGLFPDRRPKGRKSTIPAKETAYDSFWLDVVVAEPGDGVIDAVFEAYGPSLDHRQRALSGKHR